MSVQTPEQARAGYRLEALRLANESAGMPDEIVARAEAFFAFLTKEADDATAKL